MKALILNNKVVDLTETPFEVHPSMIWMDAPNGCAVGWILENGVIVDSDKRTNEQRAADNLQKLRAARNAKLARTDHWMLPDRTPTPEQIAYRQALRDITDRYTSVYDVVWPEMPE